MTSMKSLLRDQNGTASVQYAMVVGVLTFAVLAGCYALRGPLIDLYDGMANKASAALTGHANPVPAAQRDG